MTDIGKIVTRVKQWRRRMAGEDGQPPSIFHSRAYVRRIWRDLKHEECEEVLDQVFRPKQIGADVLQFERHA